jgi:threonyl-tRNA synthetase
MTSEGKIEGFVMVSITLPDGSQKQFENAPTVQDVAASIGAGLAKAALAGKVDGKLVDTSFKIDHDAKLEIVTEKSADALDIIRHSTAHLLAQATQRLFPDTQVTIGPVVENGFYYDFARKTPFTPDDLTRIEAEMKKIAAENLAVQRSVMAKDDAIKFFKDKGEIYKAEIIDDIIPPGEEISLYGQGEWIDLCRGPHVPSTGKLKAFKLMKVAGAYWRGDQNNEMLQRVYGTAWLSEKDLNAYLHQLEEAEKRDHRKLGKQLDLFHMQDEAPGLVFWHPKGWSIWQVVEQHMRRVYVDSGYQEVRCPQVLDVSLWQKSGHWDNYKENMFFVAPSEREGSGEEPQYALKPMNCPGACLVYASGRHSYRELPLKLAEFGLVSRYEREGVLHGLLRVRAFTQDDAHVFCTLDHVTDEVDVICAAIDDLYERFGFDEVRVELSTRPEKSIGTDEQWERAEEALRGALETQGREYDISPGEGTFYGPKIDFHVTDALGRSWQCGTCQLDFQMPERFDLTYTGADNADHRPVMIHRALLGSMERFVGILIEHYGGRFPLWLAPTQALVLPVADRHNERAHEIVGELRRQGFRAGADERTESVGKKIRDAELAKAPYMLVVGDKETDSGSVSVRHHGEGDLGTMSLDDLAARLDREIGDA